ncbi:MAG: NADH-quinone oxidoreductase subunit N [bacterium]|nr:NADH-quinone oxidoreductase subunit N [bacterium]
MVSEISFTTNDFLAVSGELTLAFSIVFLILWDIFSKTKNRLTFAVVTGLLIFLSAAVSILNSDVGHYFSNTFKVDGVSDFIKLFSAVVGILAIWLSLPRFQYHGEYYILLASVIFGIFIVASSADFIVLILGLETVSIPSYVLAGYFRTDRKSGEAALKYVLYGAVSVGIMLFGFSLIYGLTGETTFTAIKQSLTNLSKENHLLMLVSMILMMAGFGYKIASVPFHFWCPDVYEGAPTPMTAFFSVAPKAAGFIALSRFLIDAVPENDWITYNWQELFWWISVATMTLGNLAALPQTNLKRLLAYSSIAQAGYIFTVFTVNTQESYTALSFYLIAYLFMNLGAFAVVDWIERQTGKVTLEQYKGYGKKNPFVAVLFSIFLFSLAGLPPLAGFIGKFLIFKALLDGNQLVLAVISVINTVISLVYYVKIIREMFLTEEPHQEIEEEKTELSLKWFLIVCTLPTIVFGIAFNPAINFLETAVQSFFNTTSQF